MKLYGQVTVTRAWAVSWLMFVLCLCWSRLEDCEADLKIAKQICYTVVSSYSTASLSPPELAPPQVNTVAGLDLLHTVELIPHCTAVTTVLGITPGHHRFVAQNGSKSTV